MSRLLEQSAGDDPALGARLHTSSPAQELDLICSLAARLGAEEETMMGCFSHDTGRKHSGRFTALNKTHRDGKGLEINNKVIIKTTD